MATNLLLYSGNLSSSLFFTDFLPVFRVDFYLVFSDVVGVGVFTETTPAVKNCIKRLALI
jgi:hypothetical protein